MSISRFFKKNCPVCDSKVDKLENAIRLKASDGTHTVYVCDNCACFFEDSAEIQRKQDENDEKSV